MISYLEKDTDGVAGIMALMEHIQKHYGLKVEYYNLNEKLDIWSDWPKDDIKLIITGVGVNNVISALSAAVYLGILNPCVDVINVGYAGANWINVGEVVCVKDAHCFEFPKIANTEIKNCIKLSNEGFDCYTSFDFVSNAYFITEPVVFDMELAYIARFIHRSLYSIKIVSDNLDYNGFKEFNGEEAWKKAIDKIEERRRVNVSRYSTP